MTIRSDLPLAAPIPNLRAERLAVGLSQKELAHQAGCSTSYVRMCERGYRPERSIVGWSIRDVLDCAAHNQRLERVDGTLEAM